MAMTLSVLVSHPFRIALLVTCIACFTVWQISFMTGARYQLLGGSGSRHRIAIEDGNLSYRFYDLDRPVSRQMLLTDVDALEQAQTWGRAAPGDMRSSKGEALGAAWYKGSALIGPDGAALKLPEPLPDMNGTSEEFVRSWNFESFDFKQPVQQVSVRCFIISGLYPTLLAGLIPALWLLRWASRESKARGRESLAMDVVAADVVAANDAAAMPIATTGTLDYAPRPRIAWWQQKRLYYVAASLALIGAGCHFSRPCLRQAQIVWRQRMLTGFQSPPGIVAFTSDRQEAERLLAGGKHVLAGVGYFGSGGAEMYGRFAGYSPAELDELFDQAKIFEGPVSFEPHVRLRDQKALSPLGPPPTLFVGLRRSAGGQPRLVHVSMELFSRYVGEDVGRFVRGKGWKPWLEQHKKESPASWSDDSGWSFLRLTLFGEVFAPATLWPGSRRVSVVPPGAHEPREDDSGPERFLIPWRTVERMRRGDSPFITDDLPADSPLPLKCRLELEMAPLRIFYGHPDPADESRFVIPYECDGEKGQFVGTLKRVDGGELIEWQVEGPVPFWPPYRRKDVKSQAGAAERQTVREDVSVEKRLTLFEGVSRGLWCPIRYPR